MLSASLILGFDIICLSFDARKLYIGFFVIISGLTGHSVIRKIDWQIEANHSSLVKSKQNGRKLRLDPKGSATDA